MKSKLSLKPHTILDGENVIEVRYDGRLICTVTGLEGPGIRVFAKHPTKIVKETKIKRTKMVATFGVELTEITIDPTKIL